MASLTFFAEAQIMSTPSPRCHLVELTDRELLFVNGPDAAKFLQGQVTCDIKELAGPLTRLGAQCNPKGRILLSFRALQLDGERIALRIPRSMGESAQKTLGKYIVFSKAKLQADNGEYRLFGLWGEEALQSAARFFEQLPDAIDGWTQGHESYALRLGDNRLECWIATAQVPAFLSAIGEEVQTAHLDHWQALDIAAGIADVYPETIELFTPQELNYQLVQAVSFRKGCYTGQEIVARLHYRGKLKRHMYRCDYKGDQLPAPGTPVIHDETGQTLGAVVVAVGGGEQPIELLASVLDEPLAQAKVEGAGEKLRLLSLPYAIPTADEAL